MYRMGEAEIRRIRRLIESGRIFRYGSGGECDRFEGAWAARLGVPYARMTRSGTSALYTALVGLGVGPGDQVVVPAYTYMATALSVLSAGAIPVIADVDESLTLSATDLERRLTRHTRAVIPVHMVGLPCDMDGIMKVARRHDLLVLEDACQAVGGGYRGTPLGAIGHAGAFSFNFFKNITSGEGGAFATRSKAVYDRGSVAVDCCAFYWDPDEEAARRSPVPGGPAVRRTQLPSIRVRGSHPQRPARPARPDAREDAGTEEGPHRGRGGRRADPRSATTASTTSAAPMPASSSTGRSGRGPSRRSSAAGGWAASSPWTLAATSTPAGSRSCGSRGRTTRPWTPSKIAANRKCRVTYTDDMCSRSLDILGRAVLVPLPSRRPQTPRSGHDQGGGGRGMTGSSA